MKIHRFQSYNKYNHNCSNYPTTYSSLDCYNSPYKVIDVIVEMNPESSNSTWSIKSTIGLSQSRVQSFYISHEQVHVFSLYCNHNQNWDLRDNIQASLAGSSEAPLFFMEIILKTNPYENQTFVWMLILPHQRQSSWTMWSISISFKHQQILLWDDYQQILLWYDCREHLICYFLFIFYAFHRLIYWSGCRF